MVSLNDVLFNGVQNQFGCLVDICCQFWMGYFLFRVPNNSSLVWLTIFWCPKFQVSLWWLILLYYCLANWLCVCVVVVTSAFTIFFVHCFFNSFFCSCISRFPLSSSESPVACPFRLTMATFRIASTNILIRSEWAIDFTSTLSGRC